MVGAEDLEQIKLLKYYKSVLYYFLSPRFSAFVVLNRPLWCESNISSYFWVNSCRPRCLWACAHSMLGAGNCSKLPPACCKLNQNDLGPATTRHQPCPATSLSSATRKAQGVPTSRPAVHIAFSAVVDWSKTACNRLRFKQPSSCSPKEKAIMLKGTPWEAPRRSCCTRRAT